MVADFPNDRDFNREAGRGYTQATNSYRGGSAQRGVPSAGGGYPRRGGFNGAAYTVRPPQKWEGECENGGAGWNGGPQPPQWNADAPPPVIQNERWQEPPPPAGQWVANDRWKEPQRRSATTDSRGGGFGNPRWKESSESDWTTLTAKDDRVELEMFGTGNSGINFDKYEDIPVEATGNDVPTHINTVRLATRSGNSCVKNDVKNNSMVPAEKKCIKFFMWKYLSDILIILEIAVMLKSKT